MTRDQSARCTAAGALLLALLLALAPASRAIDNGACIVEVPVSGSLGLQGTVSYSVLFDDYSGNNVRTRRFTTKVTLKGGDQEPKGNVSGIIPLVFPSGTACAFTDTATESNDPGYAALTQALASAKIGTDKHPAYKVKVGNFSSKVTVGNPGAESDFGTWLVADWWMENLATDFDLTAKGALKPGTPKTYKTTATLTSGTLSTDASFHKGRAGASTYLEVDVPTELKLTKTTPCKVTVTAGAVSLECPALTLTTAYSARSDTHRTTARLLLKGGALAGGAPLRSAKVLATGA